MVHPLRRLAAPVATAAVLTVSTACYAQVPPESNVAVGRTLALQLCTPCHVVAADQPAPPILRNPAPSFASVAGRPGVTAEALRQFLLTTHATVGTPLNMPNPELVEYQVPPLVSYILSQRNQPAAHAPAVQPAPPTDDVYKRVLERSREPEPRSLDEVK